MLILGCAAVAVGWVYERSLREIGETASLSIPDDIDYFMTNMNYRALSSAGKLDFEFHTPRLEHYPHNDVSNLQTPSIRIETETLPWLVDSLVGEYQHANNLLHLTRDVVMQRKGQSPVQVFTQSIRFEPDREWITADSEITMLQPNSRIVAERGEFDLAGQVYKLKRTRAVYHHEDS